MSEGSLRSPSRSTRSSCVAVSASVHMAIDTWPTRSSVDVDKPWARRLGSSNIVPFHMLSIISSYVLSWVEIQLEVTQGYRKWTPFDSLHTSSSSSLSIVTMMLFCVVHEILVENLEIFIPATEFENLFGGHKLEWLGWDITSERDG